MDYKAVSQQVVDNVGGLENIEGATHCVTRLRLVLKDTSKYNKAELENIDGVKGVLYNSGQLMIIFGTGTVNKVYDEFMALTGVKEI
ncbi:MAG: glucose PTS transporter subunit EIIB, partial [Collinsella sp.]|nr:glucose PTS transporter subunit EIIB [Collinsella sp.]